LHGSPGSSKDSQKKNGRYVSKILRGEIGTTSERSKDWIARNLIAQKLLPIIETYGCSTAEEIAYGSTRNFDHAWPNEPNKPIPAAVSESAMTEVKSRTEYYERVDYYIKRHSTLLTNALDAISQLLHNTSSPNFYLLDSKDDVDPNNWEELPALYIDLFSMLERLRDCRLFAPVRPPALTIDLVRKRPEALRVFSGDDQQTDRSSGQSSMCCI
jgi:hypothetical protein